ncbi:MAG TPA: ABC-F family ATP-binding cassette domain-containing protein [Mycobacteriales bacterium]|nr:ABC-F family ATP-binding cassette domain-containing protein [Mycobacteriales bacterium]
MTTARPNLVNLEAVSKAYGTTVVLDAVSLGVGAGERIGLVGPNGAGKTTLLRLLARREQPDTGRVSHTSGLRIGYVDQRGDLPGSAAGRGDTVRDVVLRAGTAEHEWAGDAAVRAVLAGLGLTGPDQPGQDQPGLGMDAPVGPLSGGERRRVGLAAALIHPTDLLILDEPTNHLDVEGVAWLAAHLRARRGALVVVTHDRWFLDAVCDGTWELSRGQVQRYDGGYAAYVLARAERAKLAVGAEVRRQNLLRKELAWLRRGPPARTSKPKFRIEAAAALVADVPPPRDTVELHRFAASRLGKTVYDVEDVTLRAGEKTLLERATWRLGPGDRVGLVGVNGSGKTTFLRLLAGEVSPAVGRVVVGRTVRAACLSQDVTELPPTLRVLEAVSEVGLVARLGTVELSAAQLAERFGFPRGRQWTPVADLSGGERRRLQLMRLLMGEPNVLLLDEPTNDLDVDTLTSLEDVLDGWPGSLVVVSHDRYLVERVCDTVYALLGDGKLSALPGGVEEYLERRRAAVRAEVAVPAGSGPSGAAAVRNTAVRNSAAQSGAVRSGAAQSRTAKKELARLERVLARLEEREAALHHQLAEHATDYQRVTELDADLRAVRAEREEAETAWLELSDTL